MTTDISEKGLETLIIRHMTGTDGLDITSLVVAETPDGIAAQRAGGVGYFAGSPKDYDRAHALDVVQRFSFLHATQPAAHKKLALADPGEKVRPSPPNRSRQGRTLGSY